jgi:hypothetical protein
LRVQFGLGTAAAAAAAAAAGAAVAMSVFRAAALRGSIWANAVWLKLEARAASSAAPNATLGVPVVWRQGLCRLDVSDDMIIRSSNVELSLQAVVDALVVVTIRQALSPKSFPDRRKTTGTHRSSRSTQSNLIST